MPVVRNVYHELDDDVPNTFTPHSLNKNHLWAIYDNSFSRSLLLLFRLWHHSHSIQCAFHNDMVRKCWTPHQALDKLDWGLGAPHWGHYETYCDTNCLFPLNRNMNVEYLVALLFYCGWAVHISIHGSVNGSSSIRSNATSYALFLFLVSEN